MNYCQVKKKEEYIDQLRLMGCVCVCVTVYRTIVNVASGTQS